MRRSRGRGKSTRTGPGTPGRRERSPWSTSTRTGSWGGCWMSRASESESRPGPARRGRGDQVSRLNWGCGSHTREGWINSDIKEAPEVDLVADIKKGLPLAAASIDYAVSVHALPELP